MKNHWNSYLKKKATEKVDSRACSLESPELSSGESTVDQKTIRKTLFAEWLLEGSAGDGNLESVAGPAVRGQEVAATVEESLPLRGYFSQAGESGFLGELSQQFYEEGELGGCGVFDFISMQEFPDHL